MTKVAPSGASGNVGSILRTALQIAEWTSLGCGTKALTPLHDGEDVMRPRMSARSCSD